jgi:methionyl-tRNA formyltransferase
MKIVFFGSPTVALPSLEALIERGHSVELVIAQPDKPAGRGRKLTACPVKRFSEERGVPVITPEKIRKDTAVIEDIRKAGPDIQVVAAYGQIIPGNIIYLPRFNTLNVHFSLLPKYRGAAPVHWTILNGDSETGVTVIEINEKMDEGDILASAVTAVKARETRGELEARLAVTGAELLVETLERIDDIRPRPQDHSLATLAPKIRKEDGLIDWNGEAAAVDRKVRAFAPKPGAFTFLQGRRIQVHRGLELESTHKDLRPGEIQEMGREGLTIACGARSCFLIEELQPDGKARMTGYAFSLGGKIRQGAVFGDPD